MRNLVKDLSEINKDYDYDYSYDFNETKEASVNRSKRSMALFSFAPTLKIDAGEINLYKATTFNGREIGDGQVVHGQNSHGDEDNLKTLGLSCVRYLGSDCLEVLPKNTEAEKAAFAQRQREITADLGNKSSEIQGSSLYPDNFDDAIGRREQNDLIQSYNWVPTTRKPIIKVLPENPTTESFQEIYEKKPQQVEQTTCDRSYLVSPLGEVQATLKAYQDQFLSLLNQPLVAAAYWRSKDDPEEYEAIMKLSPNPLWVGEGEQITTLSPVLPPDEDQNYATLISYCSWRGGKLPVVSDPGDYQRLLDVCQEDKLGCESLLLRAWSRGNCRLTWDNDEELMIQTSDSLSARWCSKTDRTLDQQRKFDWNTHPYIFMSVSSLDSGLRNSFRFFHPYFRIPYGLVRTLCVFESDHPLSKFTTFAVN